MSRVTYCFFSLGGVILAEFSDPDAPGGTDRLPARVILADPHDPDDGVMSEKARGLPPERRVPWIDAAARDSAIRSAAAHRLDADAEAYLRSTPCYAGESPYYRGEE